MNGIQTQYSIWPKHGILLTFPSNLIGQVLSVVYIFFVSCGGVGNQNHWLMTSYNRDWWTSKSKLSNISNESWTLVAHGPWSNMLLWDCLH